MALDGALPVGRIGANRMAGYPEVGAVGFFEANSEATAEGLLKVAQDWLRSKGMKKAVGPMMLNTWFPYRFRLDDHDLNFRWEPTNPIQYPDYFAKAGFSQAEVYHSPAADNLAAYVEATFPAVKALEAKGFTFRPFDGANFLNNEIPKLYDLTLATFKNNFLYEPISLEFFRELYVPFAAKLDYSFSYFCVAPDGREVGFFFSFPDQGYLVFKTIGVHPDYQGLGLSTAMSAKCAVRGVETGLTKFVTGLVKDGNRSESYTKKNPALWSHRYALFEKAL